MYAALHLEKSRRGFRRAVENAKVVFGKTAALEHGDMSRDIYK